MACLYFSAWLLKLHDKIKWLKFTVPFYILMSAKLELNKVLTDSLFTFANFFVKNSTANQRAPVVSPSAQNINISSMADRTNFPRGVTSRSTFHAGQQRATRDQQASAYNDPSASPSLSHGNSQVRRPGTGIFSKFTSKFVRRWVYDRSTWWHCYLRLRNIEFSNTHAHILLTSPVLPSFRTRWFLDWHCFLSLRSWTLKQRAAGAEMILSVRDANWWITNIKSRVPMFRDNLEISGSDFHA